jgi:hypothetical protein
LWKSIISRDVGSESTDHKLATTKGVPASMNGRARLAEGRFNLENSWVDLEGIRGHGATVQLENNPNTLFPRFYINDGLFCAYRRSSGNFN